MRIGSSLGLKDGVKTRIEIKEIVYEVMVCIDNDLHPGTALLPRNAGLPVQSPVIVKIAG